MIKPINNIDQIIENIKVDEKFSSCIECWDNKIASRGKTVPITGVHPRITKSLDELGIDRLFSHQAEAITQILQGKNVLIVTGTASGKSLCYQIPLLQTFLETGSSTALLLFPTKALTYDQLYAINGIESLLFPGKPVSAVYDGDTPAANRQHIRNNAKNLLTNPDMLNIALLPYHTNWAPFFQNLRYIVIDELHQYRGIFGSHFCNILRRLTRVLDFYGAKPQFILTSATIGNPKELAEKVIEKPIYLIDNDQAPKGEKNTVLYNPPLVNPELGIREGLLNSTVKISSYLLENNVQSIVFCQSRRLTELVVRQMREKFPLLNSQIRGYRSGYLKSERRDIERDLKDGKIRLVAATNALELGVDIGGVDAVIIAGYPGSVSSLKQMSGRAGRSNKSSISIFVASMNPLDQFFARFPQYLFSMPIEKALIDPNNPLILLPHIQSSAFEYPFTENDKFGNLGQQALVEYLNFLVENNVLQKILNKYFYLSSVFPAGSYSIRGTATTNIILQIEENGIKRTIGEVDYDSGLWMCHQGAVYIHDGIEYHVDSLDLKQNIATLSNFNGTYRTDPIKSEQVTIEEVIKIKKMEYLDLKFGDVNVISQVTGFKKIDTINREILGTESLDMPTTNLTTKGFWLTLNQDCIKTIKENSKWYGEANDYGPNWKIIRERVLSRDGNTCQSCGKGGRTNYLHVHHKIPFKSFSSQEFANSLENLITLCSDCHKLAEVNVKIRSCISGLRYAIYNMAPLLVLCDPRDLGSISDPNSSFEDFSPVVLVHDTIPGGIGLSDSLYERFNLLVQKCYDLIVTCPCENGCPSCVGPASENGEGGKSETLYLISLINGKNG
jgi:DEAD/DEAH box helicase domain-containing protein